MGHVCGKQNTIVTTNNGRTRDVNGGYDQHEYDCLLELLLVGDPNTGKSCLLNKRFNDTFSSDYLPTIGVNCSSANASVRDVTVKLQVWDTAGQERFRSITSAYYRGTRGVILVYDVTNLQTFEHLSMWLDTVTHYAETDTTLLIAGNKTDADERVVSEETAREFAASVNAHYIETSCKDGTNVHEIFTLLADEILKKSACNQPAPNMPNMNTIGNRKQRRLKGNENDNIVSRSQRASDDESCEDASPAQAVRSLDKKSAHSNTKPASFDYLFKLTIVGDAQTGKSSLMNQFSQHSFSDTYKPTIGVEFTTSTGKVGDTGIKLQIWDTAGQERFRNITQSYYRGSMGILLVYDVTDLETFHNLTKWLADIKQFSPDSIIVTIVGNKCDATERAVTLDEAQEFATSANAEYVEVSSKDGTNVNKLFTTMATTLLEKTGKEVPGRAWWKTADAGWQ